jgi:hypothetical protein
MKSLIRKIRSWWIFLQAHYRPTTFQKTAHKDDNKYTHLCGGVASGKTTALLMEIYRRCMLESNDTGDVYYPHWREARWGLETALALYPKKNIKEVRMEEFTVILKNDSTIRFRALSNESDVVKQSGRAFKEVALDNANRLAPKVQHSFIEMIERRPESTRPRFILEAWRPFEKEEI